MTNKEKLAEALQDMNRNIGCYDAGIEDLNENNLKKVLAGLQYGTDTDVPVCINRRKYMVEIVLESDEHEADFYISSLKDYNEKYDYE